MPPAFAVIPRRQALRDSIAVAAGLLTPAIAAASSADAELIRLCCRFDAETHAVQRYDALAQADDRTTPMAQGDLELLLDRWHDTVDAIIAVPARTGAGIRAKATALGHALIQKVAVDTERTFEEQAEDYELLAMSLVRDLAGAPA